MSMHPENSKPAKRPFGADRPFPRRCRRCGKTEVVMGTASYDPEILHEERMVKFTIPQLHLPICQACGEKVFTEKVSDQIRAAFRAHLHLLTPAEIRAGLGRLNMTPKEAAERLGIEEDTLLAWLDDRQIQSRALDNLMRVFFASPEVREMLRGTNTIEPGNPAEEEEKSALPVV